MTIPCLTCRAELDDSYKSCPRCGNEISDFAHEYSIKPVNGTYELLGRIRGGGMGEVFRARHVIFETDFIIKVMKPEIRDNAGLQKRFIREAVLSRRVRQENVAAVADAGRLPGGVLFMVADFIERKNVADVIRAAGRLEPLRCLHISRQVLKGLEAIHAARLVHRDISPDNIMLSQSEDGTERATIIDFGIAKLVGGDYSMRASDVLRFDLPPVDADHDQDEEVADHTLALRTGECARRSRPGGRARCQAPNKRPPVPWNTRADLGPTGLDPATSGVTGRG